MKNDKTLERDRYDSRAVEILSASSFGVDKVDGPASVDITLRAPYLKYASIVRSFLSRDKAVLELGAGTGAFTGVLLRSGAEVCAIDISTSSLRVLSDRYRGGGRLSTRVADMECLPFQDGQFDMVASAGSLSYGDNDLVMQEIYRVLKPGGCFVCVDSLNHNPIYRLNRWIHYLRGNRTKGTLVRMPTNSLFERYRKRFCEVDVHFFGGFSWLLPIMILVVGRRRAARLLDQLDDLFSVKNSAFKFVLVARKGQAING